MDDTRVPKDLINDVKYVAEPIADGTKCSVTLKYTDETIDPKQGKQVQISWILSGTELAVAEANGKTREALEQETRERYTGNVMGRMAAEAAKERAVVVRDNGHLVLRPVPPETAE